MFFKRKKSLTMRLIIDDTLLRERLASTADENEALDLLKSEGFKNYDPADLRVIVGGAFAEILEFSPDSSTLLTPDEYLLEKDRKRALIEQRTQEFFDAQLKRLPIWLRSEFDFEA